MARRGFLYHSDTVIDGVEVEFMVTRSGEVKFSVDGRERPCAGRYDVTTGVKILLWVREEWYEVLDLGLCGEYWCVAATPELEEAYIKVGFVPEGYERLVYYA